MRLRRGKRLFRLVEHRYETTFAKAMAVKDVDLEKRLHGLCRDLLSNPVIEDYKLQKEESGKQEKRKR